MTIPSTDISVAFLCLPLGWTDGYSFVPVGFNMLSSANKSNRYQEIYDNIDRRTNGFKLGLDVIGMVKQLKQRYYFNGKAYTLPELQRFVNYNGTSNIFGSLLVTTKNGISTKIVFVRNRNKKSECLYILSTNVTLSDSEIIRIYGNRWSIECFFKASKSFMKLGTEFQCRSY